MAISKCGNVATINNYTTVVDKLGSGAYIEGMKNATMEPSKLNLESLYQTETAGFREAANEFARTYWAQPRKVRDFATHPDGSATFSVVNGSRTYVVTSARGTFGNLAVVSFLAS